MSNNPLLTIEQVAERLAVSPRSVRRLADSGKGPRPLRVGALLRWSAEAVEDWIAQGCPDLRKQRGGR